MGNEYVVAIDFGTSQVVTLVGKKADKGRIEIVASAVGDSMGGMARGEIKNSEHISKAVKETVDTIQNELGITIREAYVGISGPHVKCSRQAGYIFIENNDGEVKARDVQRLNESMNHVHVPVGEAIIHILPQKYTVDGEGDINDPVGVLGKKLEATFNIVTGDKSSLVRVENCLKKINVRMSQLMLNPLAAAEAVLVPDEKELGVAVVDIGGGTADLCIYHDNIIRHVAIIPLGGNTVNKDIRSYGILERHVESLKVKFGSAVGEMERADKYITIPGLNARDPKEISFRNLASIIEARMLDIVDCVMAEIRRSGYLGRLGAGIVLTGGAANLKNMDVLFRQHTGCEVRVAIPDLYVMPDSVELVNNPLYSAAVGLLLKAVRDGVASQAVAQPTVGTARLNPSGPAQPGPDLSQARPVSPMMNPIGEAREDDDDQDETPGKNRKGIFGRLSDRFTGMFDVIDDDKI
ncbi:MAG: cell division protein FtsA [Rikenellaceae bacterium]|jgi:cell division protein FtsA|nr:cell division protein FtsA [Rikenellaceae bacterium]